MLRYIIIFAIIALLTAIISPLSNADESILKDYNFSHDSQGWNYAYGGVSLSNADGNLIVPGRMVGSDYLVGIFSPNFALPSTEATVLQIQVDAGSATSCAIQFTTTLAPEVNAHKQVEFSLQSGMNLYTISMADVPGWINTINGLRISFKGMKDGDTAKVAFIKILNGAIISTPFNYTPRVAGDQKPLAVFRLGSIYGSNMVVQRGVKLPVWGHAHPDESITVRFHGQTVSTKADAQGKWTVNLAPESAGGPYDLTVAGTDNGDSVQLANILVGDVWICAGQSNMGKTPEDCPVPDDVKAQVLAFPHPDLRAVGVPLNSAPAPIANDALEDPLTWNTNQRSWSAVSYFFGEELQATQHVPIGLVFLIAAGTQIEQWMSPQALANAYTPAQMQNPKIFGRKLASGMYNGMISPVLPFPVRGAIWYQGESNSDNSDMYMAYNRALPAFIHELRDVWNEPAMPVMLVQLPGYDDGYAPESWAFIRNAQLEASQTLKNVGLAVTVDTGEKTNLHPPDKYPVGHRLALAARAMVYAEKIEYSGPVFENMQVAGNQAILSFSHAEGMTAQGGDPSGFEISSDGITFVPAVAKIDGTHITVSSPSVSAPIAVRYAWHNWPDGNIYNSAALPASPFWAGKR